MNNRQIRTIKGSYAKPSRQMDAFQRRVPGSTFFVRRQCLATQRPHARTCSRLTTTLNGQYTAVRRNFRTDPVACPWSGRVRICIKYSNTIYWRRRSARVKFETRTVIYSPLANRYARINAGAARSRNGGGWEDSRAVRSWLEARDTSRSRPARVLWLLGRNKNRLRAKRPDVLGTMAYK